MNDRKERYKGMVTEKERAAELDAMRREILSEGETLNDEEVRAFLEFLKKLKSRSN